MARPKAADHGEKRDAILHRAAELFAREGYHRASLSQLAEAGGVSKSLVYHYYSSKESLLFDVIERHIIGLVDAVAEADDAALPPEARLEALVMALLERYRDADSAHKVQMNDLDHLPPAQQAVIKAEQRELVRRFSAVIGLINPGLVGTAKLRPATMSLFGMLNWHYTWFKEGGAMSRAEYARFATRLFVEGVRKVG